MMKIMIVLLFVFGIKMVIKILMNFILYHYYRDNDYNNNYSHINNSKKKIEFILN